MQILLKNPTLSTLLSVVSLTNITYQCVKLQLRAHVLADQQLSTCCGVLIFKLYSPPWHFHI